MTEPTPRPRKRVKPSLEAGVDRLSGSTEGLTAVLERLSETQLRLASTETKIDQVEAEAVRQDELAARDRLESRFRKMFWIALASALLLALAMTALVSNSAHGTCERRQESTVAVIDVLESFKQPGQDNSRLLAGQERLKQTLNKTCDEQYPIHF